MRKVPYLFHFLTVMTQHLEIKTFYFYAPPVNSLLNKIWLCYLQKTFLSLSCTGLKGQSSLFNLTPIPQKLFFLLIEHDEENECWKGRLCVSCLSESLERREVVFVSRDVISR